LAKADHGLALVRQEQVDLKHELRELFDFYGALAEEKGVRLLLEGRGMLYGDRLMLRRALSNLLSNALRHTAPGMDVTVRVRDSNQTVSVCVENPGEAISEKELSRLFERFYRGEPSRSHARGEGTGLGLAIVKSIVTAHGGKISASSSAGENRFTLQFPLRRRLDQQQGQPT
ncbi:MAG TPA: ATP-binding protein, partial [Noviherbaspirillum sp.]|nr:ATP-binding protein [Noviherbaspirillum sp.]